MKFDKKRTFFAGFAFLSICAFWQLYDGIIPQILKNSFDMNDAVSGFIMAFDNILALFMLPLFGTLSDKTKTQYGRRMPYIVLGSITTIILMLLLPIADNTRNLTLFVSVLFFVLFALATYRSPAVALMPDITPKRFRSKANSIINLMGAVGGIVVLGAISILVPNTENPDHMPIFVFTSSFMLISLFVLIKSTNETKLVQKMIEESEGYEDEIEIIPASNDTLPKDKKRSLVLILLSVFFWFMGYNGITTAFSKYAGIYWGLNGGSYAYTLMIAQVAAIISYIPVGIVASRIGRKKTILIGILLLTCAFGSILFFKSFSGLIFFFFILAGIGWAAINVNSYPMVVELSGGSSTGKYTGYYYTASQAAQVMTPILSGFVLEYGYILLGSSDPNAGYGLLFPYGTIFVALSFITMLFVKHGDSKHIEKSEKLEYLDIDN